MKTLAIAHSPPAMDRSRFSELIRDHHQPLLAYARVLAGHPERARDDRRRCVVTPSTADEAAAVPNPPVCTNDADNG